MADANKEDERNREVYAIVGELVMLAVALDTLLNSVVVQVLELGSRALIEPVVATLDTPRKLEMLKERIEFIENPDWRKPVAAFVSKVESVFKQRNIACHTPAVLQGGKWTFSPVQAAKVLKFLDLEKPGAKHFPIADMKVAISTAEKALGEGVNIVDNFIRANEMAERKRTEKLVAGDSAPESAAKLSAEI